MIRLTSLAALIALAASLVNTAAGAETKTSELPPPATLKRAITVTEPVVRIGDLVDNSGRLAIVPVFRAPDIGTTGTVSTAMVLEALRPYRLFTVDTGDITEVEVTRAGRVVTAAEIKARITRAYAGQYGLGEAGSLSLISDREIRAFAIEPNASPDLAVSRANYEPRTGRFDILLEVPGSSAARRVPLRFTGTLQQVVEAVILTRSLQRGEVVKASDLLVERRPKPEIPIDAVTSDERIIGLAARQQLHTGQAIRRADLTKPDLVKRDDAVTLIYEVPGLLLTTRGKALEAGAEGDMVSAVNLTSKRTIQGIVTGTGQITIAAPRVLASSTVHETAAPAPVAPNSGE